MNMTNEEIKRLLEMKGHDLEDLEEEEETEEE